MYTLPKLERFNQNVLSKYNIYNSVFITLPFDAIDNTGVLLPLFSEVCDASFKKNWSPKQIVDFFAEKYLDNASEEQKIDLMFRFIQYVERQIVLFDAIEDAAFPIINNLEGLGSLRDIKEKSESKEKHEELVHFLENFNVRTVLTAHPTQFYPGSVLGIITDLTEAIRQNDLLKIKQLLAQLGKTPFFKKEKPTPFDEAVSLVWYLENVFYQTIGDMMQYLQKNVFDANIIENPIVNLGFWPGGDRDGNPFVTPEITQKVADRLRTSILKCYYFDVRALRRKLTFNEVDSIIISLENRLYRSVFYSQGDIFISLDELKNELNSVKEIIISKHNSLYLDEVNLLLQKITQFGFHFASLDIRQNSHIHNQVFEDVLSVLRKEKAIGFPEDFDSVSEKDKMKIISALQFDLTQYKFENEITVSTLETIKLMREIQSKNGEQGCNRYIISNNESAMNVVETFAMFRLLDWENPTVDIVPLFESIDDLQKADVIMEQLYQNEIYRNHLRNRKDQQTVMLGFSDGTKDGGYLMANWSIFRAKETITEISRKYGIKVIFFDGRGGPPARGGGKTHKFYASLGSTIENQQIQITIQGQTISSNFGTLDSCRYNLENLLSAGVANQVFSKDENNLSDSDKAIIDDLANRGYQKYIDFKSHPKFIPYLEKISPMAYNSKTNIGSRPAKRNTDGKLNFSDLRAIPFVSAWSQLKQNVPGFFGLGTALRHYEENNQWEKVKTLYDDSLFFRTLLENSMMSLAKCFFPLTAYVKDDVEFGDFWQIIYDEYLETKRLLLKISGHNQLMENYPDGKASIDVREQIVMPLLAIQQYASSQINEMKRSGKVDEKLIVSYEKLVTRSLFGNTNAARNSV